jgi:AraC family transcriptional regulator
MQSGHQIPFVLSASTMRSPTWMCRVIELLDTAARQLHQEEHQVYAALREAASLLREQVAPAETQAPTDSRGGLLVWQARKVRDYINAHITEPVRIADLCALIQRSEAHFSRAFRRTFGEPPHAFVIRRRLELAAHYMLNTDESLSDISQRCGFSDQAHLCKHFRQLSGQSPAAWRRVRRAHREERTAAHSVYNTLRACGPPAHVL